MTNAYAIITKGESTETFQKGTPPLNKWILCKTIEEGLSYVFATNYGYIRVNQDGYISNGSLEFFIDEEFEWRESDEKISITITN
jgi:hypothetical protein